MGLKLHNPRPKTDNFTYLALSPMAEVKACLASIGGGSMMADVAVTAFKYVAAPAMIVGGVTIIAFLATVDIISDKMVQRAINKGDVKIKTAKRPQIEP